MGADVAAKFYIGLQSRMPSMEDVGESTGDALKWSIVTGNGVANTGAKLIDKSGEVINQIIDDSPKKEDIATALWNTPSNITDVMSWMWNVTAVIVSKDTAVTAVTELPWFTKKIGEAVAGPLNGFYTTLPKVRDEPEVVKSYMDA